MLKNKRQRNVFIVPNNKFLKAKCLQSVVPKAFTTCFVPPSRLKVWNILVCIDISTLELV